ncbi:hypothetical protein HDV06_002127 [Boothiomyces sp. JEL0866]|nr:hypothetical protein HDV06_002127 [Boothiomyces sp. JEL0866]
MIIGPSNRAWLPSLTFTQEDVDNSLVYVSPIILTKVGSFKTSTFPARGIDPAGTAVSVNLQFKIQYYYCLNVISNTAYIVSYQQMPVIITADNLGLIELHGLSVWDTLWAVPSVPTGRLEWYCPDQYCNGPSWQQLGPLSSIPHSWFVTNAIRWNPLGSPIGVNSTIVLTSVNQTVTQSPISINLVLAVSTTNPNTDYIPLPYQNSSFGNCPVMTLTENGVTLSGSLPFGPFIPSSPIRPLCTSITSSSTPLKVGDVTISSATQLTVGISGAVILGADLKLPKGFTPITFTGLSSKIGIIHQAFYLKIDPSYTFQPITMVLPQIKYPLDTPIQSVGQIAVLRYDAATSLMSHVAAQSYIDDNNEQPLLSITASFPDTNYYIVGYMDYTIGAIPAQPGQWINYLTSYGTMKLQINSFNMVLLFSCDANTKFAIMPAPAIPWTPDGYATIQTFSIIGGWNSGNKVSITLLAGVQNSNIFWG